MWILVDAAPTQGAAEDTDCSHVRAALGPKRLSVQGFGIGAHEVS